MSAQGAIAARPSRWNVLFQGLQKMGRSLQLPIAVLPAAGILNRLGQDDVFGKNGLGWNDVAKVMAGAGGALLDPNIGLPLLFCVGVAIGMAKKADGSTALAAVAGFLVYYNVLRQFPEVCVPGTKPVGAGCQATDGTVTVFTYQNPGVFGGIVMGLLAAFFWQRYHRTRLVDWLGFFNGRRLVPIIMSFVAIGFAVLCLWIWPPIGRGLESFSDWLVSLGAWGSGIFGVANRALLVIGLHQFLNVPIWFQLGSYTKPDGTVVHGDITMFLQGDPDAGQFTTGFFPIMMFRAARRGAGDRALGPSAPPQGGRRADALGRPDLVRDRYHGADRVLVPLRRPGAVRGARTAHRGVDGADLGTRREGRIQFLGRADRLCDQLGAGHQTLADHSDRARFRRRLLRDLPGGHQGVRSPGAGKGARADRGGAGAGQHQIADVGPGGRFRGPVRAGDGPRGLMRTLWKDPVNLTLFAGSLSIAHMLQRSTPL
ncbi:PTS transmembrane component [Streptomyces clavuligerus]|nr:PTS transmembrane component [Streptomyces clavuligerus]